MSGGVAYAGGGVSPIGHVRLGALSLAVNDSQAQTQPLSVGLSPGKANGDAQLWRLACFNLFLICPYLLAAEGDFATIIAFL